MGLAKIRKMVTIVEDTLEEGSQEILPPARRAAAIAVVENPFAGIYQEDLEALMAIGEELGSLLETSVLWPWALPQKQSKVMERPLLLEKMVSWSTPPQFFIHASENHCALPLKRGALVPSNKKRGGMGNPLDVPLGHKDAAYVRSHFDGMEVRINDAPKANEILVAIAVAESGRPLPRVGGLTHEDAEGRDGLS